MKTKLIVIWVGVFLLVGMCLYPPWISKIQHERTIEKLGSTHEMLKGYILGDYPAVIRQYSFLFSPPKNSGKSNYYLTIDYTTELDLPKLGLQLIMGIVLIGGILFTISVLGKKKEFAQGGRYEDS